MSQSNEPSVFVVAVEGTGADGHVIETAARMASMQEPAELHLVHVLRATSRDASRLSAMVVFPTFPELLEERRKLLERLVTVAGGDFKGRIVGHLAVGEPWHEIVQIATSLRATMIVVGTADREGISRFFLGSVASRVVRKAQCPVLVARRVDYEARAVPEIEPPCPDCLATQRESTRAKLWCERHATKHAYSRLHYEAPPSFGQGSMLVRP